MTKGGLYYLNRLLRLEQRFGRHKTKRANWRHFCHDCGREISWRRRYVRWCANCEFLRQSANH